MTLQLLTKRIQDTGAANAIVYLDPKYEREPAVNRIAGRGRFLRRAPVYDREILGDLAARFALGWSALSATTPLDLDTLASTIPTIRDLISGAIFQQRASHMIHFPHLGVVYGALNQQALAALADHDAVAEIYHAPPELQHIRPVEAGTVIAKQPGIASWGLQRMGAPELWQQKLSGSEILIAHLDTGMDSQHPVLLGSLSESMATDQSGTEIAPPVPFTDLDTGTGHGTHTVSVIAARHTLGEPVVGMAPAASLACGIVVPWGDLNKRFLCGMEWAVDSGARILNMSITVPGVDDAFKEVINRIRKNRILPIAAAGNSGPENSCSPACYATVLSVGAVDSNDEMVPYSSKATCPAVSAPGSDINCAAPDEKYSKEMGTSIAAPHIAGLAALLFDARPDATIDQVQKAIIASCENRHAIREDWIGAGIPNGVKALELLKVSMN